MKITDGAKTLIMEALASNSCDCLYITQEESCCGTSLNFQMTNLKAEDKAISINGVSVLMDNETQVKTEGVTLDAQDGELTIEDGASSCDCGCGCHC